MLCAECFPVLGDHNKGQVSLRSEHVIMSVISYYLVQVCSDVYNERVVVILQGARASNDNWKKWRRVAMDVC